MTTSQLPEVHAFTARMDELQRQREQVNAVLGRAEGSARSDDGSVWAKATAQGVLTDLQLGPGARDLRATIMLTVRRAMRAALVSAADEVAAIVGADNPAVAVLRRQAGDVPVDEETSTPARRDVAHDDLDDDDLADDVRRGGA